MTKCDELMWLDTAIKTLGPNSYLGPWLQEYREDITRDILSDFPVNVPLPSVARAEARSILADAESERRAIQDAAERKAAKMIEDADETIRGMRARARDYLATAARNLI